MCVFVYSACSSLDSFSGYYRGSLSPLELPWIQSGASKVSPSVRRRRLSCMCVRLRRLEGAKDWAVSRNRFWGTPMPMWVSDDGEEMVAIGSIAELKDLSGVEVRRDRTPQLQN